MPDRRVVTLRLVALMLLVANVLFAAYAWIGRDTRTPRIAQLQINPERIRILAAATRGPGGDALKAAEPATFAGACLAWGPVTPALVTRAESAIPALGIAGGALERATSQAGITYYVRDPDAGTVSRFVQLQRDFPGTSIRAATCP